MISNLIVFSSLFLAGLFTLLYLLKPGLRERVEQPKYAFLRQLSMYDMQTGAEKRSSHEGPQDLNNAQVKSGHQVENPVVK